MSKKIMSSLILLGFFSAFIAAQAAPKKAKADPKKKAEVVKADAEKAKADGKTEPAPVVKHHHSEELMESLKNKKYLNDHDFAKKKEGGFFTGLPLVNSDPNTGIGYGARVFYSYNGEKDDPIFRRTPYRTQLYAQFFQTTNGYQYHEINLDAPYIGNSLYRLRTALVFEKNTWANFYGTGSRSMNALGSDFNNGAKTYDKYADYNNELRKVDSTGLTNSAYNHYSYERPALVAMVERDLFGGIVRPQFGMQVGKYNINDLMNREVQADKTTLADGSVTADKGINKGTLLTQYNQAGLINGYNGGFNNVVRVGIAIDTRDFEPDPNKGQLFEAIAEVSNRAYGSEFNYARYTVAEKFFFSPFEKFVDLVFAGRAAYTQSVGDVPFYTMNQFSSTERTYQSALGGLRSLRGYKENRFVANNIALANLELRWTMFDFTVLGQHFAPILVPFFDIGSAFDQPKDVSTSVWRYAYGAGLRIAWNQATIIMVDYAMSKEDTNMFINFSHIF
ncbi:MAG: DUF5982 domain-containing protein [Turneriella sp.]